MFVLPEHRSDAAEVHRWLMKYSMEFFVRAVLTIFLQEGTTKKVEPLRLRFHLFLKFFRYELYERKRRLTPPPPSLVLKPVI